MTRTIRNAPSILFLALLAACSNAPTEEQDTTVPEPVVEVPMQWPGYYDGTLPCADCPGIFTQLWVRSDSTFILRQRYIDKDSMALGTIGEWDVRDGAMRLGTVTGEPQLWKYTGDRLVNMDTKSGAEGLEKLADEINDEIPRMRLTGTFTYMADAMSFRPCGSSFNWPAAGGEDWTVEGEVLGSMDNAELERRYLDSVKQGGDPWIIEVECSLAMGPAMEGDGADEYLFIHRVLGTLASGACP